MRAIGIAVCFAFASLMHTGPTRADEFPSRPVKVIVPFAAGGPVDVLARAIGSGFASAPASRSSSKTNREATPASGQPPARTRNRTVTPSVF